MKNSADLGSSASVDNTLLDLQNSSYPIKPYSIIAKYFVRHRLTSSGNVLQLLQLLQLLQVLLQHVQHCLEGLL